MAAIFDMDGLLLNTDPEIWVKSMFEVAETNAVAVTRELLVHTKGLRIHEVTDFWNEYFKWENPDKARSVAEEIVDRVISNTHLEGFIMPGVSALLETLKAHDVPIGLATSSTRRMVDDLLSYFKIDHYFDVISTADNCKMGKPHPEVYLNCAAELGVLPWRCVAFEDSVNGMVAARAARMQVVVVPGPDQFDDPQFGLANKKVKSLTEFTFEDHRALLTI